MRCFEKCISDNLYIKFKYDMKKLFVNFDGKIVNCFQNLLVNTVEIKQHFIVVL